MIIVQLIILVLQLVEILPKALMGNLEAFGDAFVVLQLTSALIGSGRSLPEL